MKKLLDYAHCGADTTNLAIVNADTVEMPAYRPACQEFDMNRPCDGPQEYCFIDAQGHDIKVCANHARRSYQWPDRYQCEVHDIDYGRCPEAGMRIYHTLEDNDERLLCSWHFAVTQLLIAIDERSAQAEQGGAA